MLHRYELLRLRSLGRPPSSGLQLLCDATFINSWNKTFQKTNFRSIVRRQRSRDRWAEIHQVPKKKEKPQNRNNEGRIALLRRFLTYHIKQQIRIPDLFYSLGGLQNKRGLVGSNSKNTKGRVYNGLDLNLNILRAGSIFYSLAFDLVPGTGLSTDP